MVDVISTGTQIPFIQMNSSNGFFSLGSIGGKHTLVGVFVSTKIAGVTDQLKKIEKSARFFQSNRAAFVGVSCDSKDQDAPICKTLAKDNVIIWDFSYQITGMFGLMQQQKETVDVSPSWILLDPMLRVVKVWPLAETDQAIKGLEKQISEYRSIENVSQPPVLILPRVFDAKLCSSMVDHFTKNKLTLRGVNHENMKRQECTVIPAPIMSQVQRSLADKVMPAIAQCFQFQAAHMDQCLIAAYDMTGKDFMGAHRDNATNASKHRKFTIMVNLNEGEYNGSEVIFPEFSLRSYKAPYGGAIIFSSALVHQQTPITLGKNYTFLCNMYDESAHKMIVQPKVPVLKSVA